MSVKYSTVTVRKTPRPTRLMSVAITRMRSTGSDDGCREPGGQPEACGVRGVRRDAACVAASASSMPGGGVEVGFDDGETTAVSGLEVGLTDPVLSDPRCATKSM